MNGSSSIRLLDIIVFIVVISTLATIALPAYHSNMRRAKAYEAEITLDVVKNILDNYFEEKKHYPIVKEVTPLIEMPEILIQQEELSGKYYGAMDYYYISNNNGTGFKIKAIGTKRGMQSIDREINETGLISKSISF